MNATQPAPGWFKVVAIVALLWNLLGVLAFLAQRAGRALTRAQISEHALPEGGDRNDRTVDSHISRIRKKLGPEASPRVQSVWGIGYRVQGDPA